MATPATSALLRARARPVRGIGFLARPSEITFGPCLNSPLFSRSYGLFFNRPRAVSKAVGVFDIVASLEARIHFERVGFRNAHTGLAGDGVVAARDRHE